MSQSEFDWHSYPQCWCDSLVPPAFWESVVFFRGGGGSLVCCECLSYAGTGGICLARVVCCMKPDPHRTRQRCSGPVCDRPSASRLVPSRQNRLQQRLEVVLTGRNGPRRARTVVNRAGTALTGAVRTGYQCLCGEAQAPGYEWAAIREKTLCMKRRPG